MAEALLKYHCKGSYEVFSAGSSPTAVNPRTLAALSHFGLNTDNLRSKHVDEFKNVDFDYVITLCVKSANEVTGRVNGKHHLTWDFPRPIERMESMPFEKTVQELNERIKMFLLIQEKQQPDAISPTAFYKALADDIRLRTLMIIAVEQEVCVCELLVALNEDSQPKVSRHLAQLRKAGLLTDRKHQQWVFYSLSPSLQDWMKKVIITTVINEPHFIEQALARLDQMGDRPTRIATCCQ